MGDPARRGLVVGQQPGQDRQAGGVGGGPGRRAEPVGGQVPARGRGGPPGDDLAGGVAHPLGGVQLDEVAGAAAYGDHVPVALVGVGVARAAALDRGVGRDEDRTAVALVAVVLAVDAELQRQQRLVLVDDVDRDAVVLLGRAEVEVQVVPGGLLRDDRPRLLPDRAAVDAPVPRVVGREELAPADRVHRGLHGPPRGRLLPAATRP